MAPTIFGPDWEELTLDDVRTYVGGSEGEPLLWEAKGPGVSASDVRRTVCAFANSHDGGYLLLGVQETRGTYDFVGMEFPDEPILWVTNVVRDGVRPWPGIDTRPFDVGGDRQVAVVWTPPLPTPPCISRGTVFERLPGQSRAVKDAAQLAELYRRGEQARQIAEAGADRAQRRLLSEHFDVLGSETWVGFALGVRAVGYRELDIGARLFSEAFTIAAEEAVAGLSMNFPQIGGPLRPAVVWSQDSIVWRKSIAAELSPDWALRADWSGAVGSSYRIAVRYTEARSMPMARSRRHGAPRLASYPTSGGCPPTTWCWPCSDASSQI
jgi:hypothetical protein